MFKLSDYKYQNFAKCIRRKVCFRSVDAQFNPESNLITACIRRMTEGNVFTLSTIAGGGGYPHPWSGRGGTPFSGLDGGTPIRTSEGGTPPSRPGMGGPPCPGQVSGWGGGGGTSNWNIACTCYAAGSMPLAFTQEDFLVWNYSNILKILLELATSKLYLLLLCGLFRVSCQTGVKNS